MIHLKMYLSENLKTIMLIPSISRYLDSAKNATKSDFRTDIRPLAMMS